MLVLPTEKAQSPKGALSNLLSLKPEFKGNDKFSTLLKSFSPAKQDAQDFIFAEIDAKGLKLGLLEEKSATKTDSKKLISLLALGNESKGDEEQLHPDIIKALPTHDLKKNIQTLIGEAKSYLKDQILQKVDIKDLPKTLGGLIKLAEKSGIDVKAISFESLPKVAFTKELSQALTLNKVQTPPVLSTKEIVQPNIVKTEKEEVQKPLNALLTKVSQGLVTEQQSVASVAVNTKETILPTQKAKASSQDTVLIKTNEIATPSIPVLDVLEEEVIKPTKALPSAITALLHGEKSSNENEGELGLKVESSKESDKPHGVTQAKVEALSQKITEAKQLITHVAQNVKESIENYKPPFTRIKMQLNPQKFGDMEVTLIQRGSNVHININASSSALTVMMQNAHELRTQLSSQGLGDASMNFSSQQQDQQQQKQKQEQSSMTYEEYQEYEEEFTEVATALEIVVPRYI